MDVLHFSVHVLVLLVDLAICLWFKEDTKSFYYIVLGRGMIRLLTISKVITIPPMSLYFEVTPFKYHVSQICF